MSTSGLPRRSDGPGLPSWAQDQFEDPTDHELQRLRRAGPVFELAVHFADKLLCKGLDPTREIVLAVIATLEANPERAVQTLDDALRAIKRLGIYNTTDSANADRFVSAHFWSVRHCRELGAWLVWDGRRWLPNSEGQVIERAKKTARSIFLEAAEETDRKRSAELAAWAIRSEDVRRIWAMVELAKSDQRISISTKDLDSDPWLLNVLNGTLDLKTGRLMPHGPHQHLTKLAPVECVPDAQHPAWDEFLERTIPDRDVRGFLARAAGYSLTGDTGEEVLFLIHGPGGSGKSTFGEAMKSLLGDYATTADFETFLQRRETGVRNDIARLEGARFVLSLEVEEGRHLAMGCSRP